MPEEQIPVTDQASAAESEALKRQLLGGYALFERSKQERRQFREINVAGQIDPAALVGRAVRVLWPDDDAWYLGNITEWDAESAEHKVKYADGDAELLCLAQQRVRLLMHAGEQLTPPAPDTLRMIADKLAQRGDNLDKQEDKQKQGYLPALQRAEQLRQLADELERNNQAAEEAAAGTDACPGSCNPTAALARTEAEPNPSGQRAKQHQKPSLPGQLQQAVPLATSSAELDQRPAADVPASDCSRDRTAAGAIAGPQASGLSKADANVSAPAANSDTADGHERGPSCSTENAAHVTEAQNTARSKWPGKNKKGAAKGVPLESFRPGDVVWGRVKGFADWPAIVISERDARHALKQDISKASSASTRARDPRVNMQFFGSGEVARLVPACVTEFRAGVLAGFHTKATRIRSVFRRALCEVVAYFVDGELAPALVPRHDDVEESDCESEEHEPPGRPPAKKRKGAKPGDDDAATTVGAVRLPMKIGTTLTVRSLGHIDWIHPAFHNEKVILPVGFRSSRLAATPASGNRDVPHVCEVLAAPDGSGPVFRVTPRGGQPHEARTAVKAWAALYGSDAHGGIKALGISGTQRFGLSVPTVMRAIEALPGAERCDAYHGWPGDKPPVPDMDECEQRARLAALARMQKLPAGIQSVPHAQQRQAACAVCDEEGEAADNLIVQCDRCLLEVHQGCYGVEEHPHGRGWLCDACVLGLERSPPCVLCPVAGGALKRTRCGRWVHSACAMWCHETVLAQDGTCVDGVDQVKPARLRLQCSVCGQVHGACIQCSASGCFTAFHPLCARAAGFSMRLEEGDDSSDSGSDAEEEAPKPGAKRRRPQQEGTALGNGLRLMASCPKHGTGTAGTAARAAAPPAAMDTMHLAMDSAHEPGDTGDARTAAGGCMPMPGDRTNGGAGGASPSDQEVGSAGKSQTLLDSARRKRTRADRALPTNDELPGLVRDRGHAGAAGPAADRTTGPRKPANPSTDRRGTHGIRAPASQTPTKAAPDDSRAANTAMPGRASAALEHTMQQAREYAARAGILPGALQGCARSRPFDHAARRGSRAPEALAAAQAKKAFVRNTLYLVQGYQQASPANIPASTCTKASEAQPASCSASQPADPKQAQPAAPGRGGKKRGASAKALAGAAGPRTPNAASACPPPAPSAPGEIMSPRSVRTRVRSLAERFADMQQTASARLTCGKSAIHGWGAFAKVPHKEGALVIEYRGELVRPTVADALERSQYDSIVGMGTYIFRLNETECVDATKRGNLAHLLNHSCDPNCFSKTLTVWNEALQRPVDHVVIASKRDIQAYQELTYDYRFAGAEKLPCNCGAATCRGYVNEPEGGNLLSNSEMGFMLPRNKLKPYKPAK